MTIADDAYPADPEPLNAEHSEYLDRRKESVTRNKIPTPADVARGNCKRN